MRAAAESRCSTTLGAQKVQTNHSMGKMSARFPGVLSKLTQVQTSLRALQSSAASSYQAPRPQRVVRIDVGCDFCITLGPETTGAQTRRIRPRARAGQDRMQRSVIERGAPCQAVAERMQRRNSKAEQREEHEGPTKPDKTPPMGLKQAPALATLETHRRTDFRAPPDRDCLDNARQPSWSPRALAMTCATAWARRKSALPKGLRESGDNDAFRL